MEHLEIVARCTGDKITAISNCLNAAKACGKEITLHFDSKVFTMLVKPTSELQDLVLIYQLQMDKISLNNIIENSKK